MSSIEIKWPSDYYRAIKNTLISRLGMDFSIQDYDSFTNIELIDRQVLIEFERSISGVSSNRGLYCHEFDMQIYALVSRCHDKAEVDAIDLASGLERIICDNKWGVKPDQIDFPTNIQSYPSIFKAGESGYVAWSVSFTQNVYLGEPLLDENILINQIRVATNPENPSNELEYKLIEPHRSVH